MASTEKWVVVKNSSEDEQWWVSIVDMKHGNTYYNINLITQEFFMDYGYVKT